MDLLLHRTLTRFVDTSCPPVDGCFVGALPKTQVLDIAHGLHLLVEKALDDHSNGAIAQQDIEKYYDSIRLLKAARWLLSKGAPVALVACALRHQWCQKLV